jgi:hypothetical protein
MMVAIVLLFVVELATYFVLLNRLANRVRASKPELFAAVGGLQFEDFLISGFFTGDGLISKLEARRDELRGEQRLIRLLKWTRITWFAQLATVVAGMFVLLST